MDLETRDRLELLLDDARKALGEVIVITNAEALVVPGSVGPPPAEWHVRYRAVEARYAINVALKELPSVRSLRVGS